MGFLDVDTAQVMSSSASQADQSAVFRATLSDLSSQAQAAEANHQGESRISFMQAHMRFEEGAGKLNALLDISQGNLTENAQTYLGADAMAAEANTAAAAPINL